MTIRPTDDVITSDVTPHTDGFLDDAYGSLVDTEDAEASL